MNRNESAMGAAGMFLPVLTLGGVILAGAIILFALFDDADNSETVIDITTPGGGVEVEQDPETDNITIEVQTNEE